MMHDQHKQPELAIYLDKIADALSLIAWGLLLVFAGYGMFADWLTINLATFLSVGAILVPIGLRLASRLLFQLIEGD